jgi:hypothetical protein
MKWKTGRKLHLRWDKEQEETLALGWCFGSSSCYLGNAILGLEWGFTMNGATQIICDKGLESGPVFRATIKPVQ